jgi:hypothetical protein
MSLKALPVSAAIAASAPVLADTGETFMGARDLAQAQQRSGIQYLAVGEDSAYPPDNLVPGSGRTMTHRGSNMPGGQGEMPDHPHISAPPDSGKPMTHRGANMPGGQGEMPEHPHQQ